MFERLDNARSLLSKWTNYASGKNKELPRADDADTAINHNTWVVVNEIAVGDRSHRSLGAKPHRLSGGIRCAHEKSPRSRVGFFRFVLNGLVGAAVGSPPAEPVA